MKKENRYIAIGLILCILVSIIGTTFAYYEISFKGESSQIDPVTSGDFNVTLSESASINENNFFAIYDENYETEAYKKEFSISNNGTLDSIVEIESIIDNTNSIILNKYLKYIVNCDDIVLNGNFSNYTTFLDSTSNTNKYKVSFGKIFVASGTTKSCTLYMWESYDENVDQSYILNQQFNASIQIEAVATKTNPFSQNSKLYDLVVSSSLGSDENIDLLNDTSSSGVYKSSLYENEVNSIDGLTKTHEIYYYRGNVSNNNLLFAGNCYLIVRTTDTGGVKILYNGVASNKTCNNNGTSVFLDSNVYLYNATSDNTSYMFNTNTSSNVKSNIDSMYSLYLDSKSSYFEDSIWCNDEVNDFNSLECNTNKYTVSNLFGNGKLNYSIGLLTINEIVYAGKSSYLNNTTTPWWTMSYIGNKMYAFNGEIIQSNANEAYGIRPSLVLRKDIMISAGDGTSNNPYVIE